MIMSSNEITAIKRSSQEHSTSRHSTIGPLLSFKIKALSINRSIEKLASSVLKNNIELHC